MRNIGAGGRKLARPIADKCGSEKGWAGNPVLSAYAERRGAERVYGLQGGAAALLSRLGRGI